jgi:hypothetical protein
MISFLVEKTTEPTTGHIFIWIVFLIFVKAVLQTLVFGD